MADSFYTDMKGVTGEIGRRGVAKNYLYSCVITLPDIIRSKFMNEQFAMQLRIEHAQIPPRQVMTAQQRYYGPPRYIPYAVMYQPMQLTINLSETMLEREVMMTWQDLAVSGGHLGSVRSSMGRGGGVAEYDATYYDDIVGTVEIYQFPESPQFQGAGGAAKGLLQTIIGTAQAVGFDPTLITRPLGFDIGLGESRRAIKPSYHIKLEEAFPTFVQGIDMDWSNGEAAKLNVEMTYYRSIEKHSESSVGSSGFDLAKMVRQGVNLFNRFTPTLSLIKGQGLGGGMRAMVDSIGSGPRATLGSIGAPLGRGSSFKLF